MSEKKPVYTYSIKDGYGYIVMENLPLLLSAIEAEAENMSVGDEITIRIIEMSEEEIANLAEFEGW